MSSPAKSYNNLNEQEKTFFKDHILDAWGISGTRDKAFWETQRIFGKNGEDDSADAFRHCYWSALLVKEIGYTDALILTRAHESDPDNNPDAKAMDLHNNSIGLEIGKLGLTDEDISHKCLQALYLHELKVIKP